MMPLGNRAEDFGVSLRAADSFLEFTDQRAYDTFYATVDADWRDSYHREFYRQREDARSNDRRAWLALHAPYTAFLDLLRRRRSDARLALATAKDRHSAELLLDHLGVGDLFRGEFILDKEAGTTKTAHLTALRDRLAVDFSDLTFVDDKVNHLEKAAPLGVRPVLAAWGFNTPREHELARRNGFAVATTGDAESVLFGGE